MQNFFTRLYPSKKALCKTCTWPHAAVPSPHSYSWMAISRFLSYRGMCVLTESTERHRTVGFACPALDLVNQCKSCPIKRPSPTVNSSFFVYYRLKGPSMRIPIAGKHEFCGWSINRFGIPTIISETTFIGNSFFSFNLSKLRIIITSNTKNYRWGLMVWTYVS